ncbi:hypothetical protein [Nonomuraea sp. CA-141351]|uniref:hypothetical protein n=1 Tax=Nonomuraea sp. CA-141351 TaxID=3239996 RepID=UPI003D8DEFB8
MEPVGAFVEPELQLMAEIGVDVGLAQLAAPAGRQQDIVDVEADDPPAHTFAFLARAAAQRLVALRGLRRGEAIGLRRKDDDLKAGTAGAHWRMRPRSAPSGVAEL